MATDGKQHIELPRFDATKIIRHIKIKSQSNPYDKAWDDYFEKRACKRYVGHKISVNCPLHTDGRTGKSLKSA